MNTHVKQKYESILSLLLSFLVIVVNLIFTKQKKHCFEDYGVRFDIYYFLFFTDVWRYSDDKSFQIDNTFSVPSLSTEV